MSECALQERRVNKELKVQLSQHLPLEGAHFATALNSAYACNRPSRVDDVFRVLDAEKDCGEEYPVDVVRVDAQLAARFLRAPQVHHSCKVRSGRDVKVVHEALHVRLQRDALLRARVEHGVRTRGLWDTDALIVQPAELLQNLCNLSPEVRPLLSTRVVAEPLSVKRLLVLRRRECCRDRRKLHLRRDSSTPPLFGFIPSLRLPQLTLGVLNQIPRKRHHAFHPCHARLKHLLRFYRRFQQAHTSEISSMLNFFFYLFSSRSVFAIASRALRRQTLSNA
mmetsp:Transcript_356/g.895  ORF Transcript_356/g.895 Transcript_356/m.895 type:complete len:280 (-) Transcript_356:11-850(-)